MNNIIFGGGAGGASNQVAVSNTAPTDEDVLIWIDTSDEGQSPEDLGFSAVDSEKLGGKKPEYYATSESVEALMAAIASLQDTIVEVTLLASNWVSDTYTLVVSGVTNTSIQEILPSINITKDQLKAYQNANIIDGGQSNDTLILRSFGDTPVVDIPIRVLIHGRVGAINA